MFYAGAYSRRIVCYGRANVCKDLPLGGAVKEVAVLTKGPFSHITFLRVMVDY